MAAFFDIAKLAFANLIVNRLRSILTVLGIVFGSGAVIATLSSNEGAAMYVRDQIKQLGTNVITVTSTGSSVIGTSELEFARRYIPEISSAALTQDIGFFGVRYGDNVSTLGVKGVASNFFSMSAMSFSKGRSFDLRDDSHFEMVAVLGATVAKSLFGQRYPIGKDIYLFVDGRPLVMTVVGVLKEKGGTGGGEFDGAVFVPFGLASKLAPPSGVQIKLLARLHDDKQSADVKQALVGLLSRKLKETVQVTDAREAIEKTQDIWQKQNLVGILLAGVCLVTGGIGIMNIMLVSIHQRRREIGIRKAVGAGMNQIFMQFILEALIVCFAGGVFGLALGSLFGIQVANLLGQWEAHITWRVVMAALGSATMTGLIFGILPAVRAAKLDPFEALRG